ncbi:hypothetical protein G8A07_03575 [Roseateles sp. DAIF2]|uniref:hypothetical protein n=1 Tax=Roseateles sp. DAIF2 TaxID=2714952 RepID=UPI0018A27966|nr:hypothetical protein [Roseateles sp. DAIF2]QPF72100.1 hypothetical protein G8A07_03575 [Roseateles sp. DAIF2]
MTQQPTPEPPYRSEAFAEDLQFLLEPAATPGWLSGRRVEALLGLLPLCTALLGFAFALL